MKLITFILLISLMQVSAVTFGQRVTLKQNNLTIERVFREIRKQTGYDVLMGYGDFKVSKINTNFDNASLTEVMDVVVKNTELTYSIEEKTIVIKRRSATFLDRDINHFANIDVHGQILDEQKKPIQGATVKVKGSKVTTTTDANGRFIINVPNENSVLVFSSVGFVTKEVPGIDGMAVTLENKMNKLEETIIVGYGSSKKKDLTGSVSTINIKEIENIPFTTVDNALAGKAAGVQVTKSDGTPGGAVRIRVRGSTSLLGGNDPLYVIDGVPMQVQNNYIPTGFDVSSPVGNNLTGFTGISGGMSTGFVNGLNSIGGLNVDDIASITILKDASSTAIYGSKAANGVVIITTKTGKKNMRPEVQFSYYGTYTKAITPKLLNGDQYRMLLSEAAKNDFDFRSSAGFSISPELDAIVHHPDTYFGKANTNWLDEVTRNTFSNNAEISIQGGGAASKYYTSISKTNTPGVIKGSDYDRISGKINLENEIGTRLRIITNVNIANVTQNITNGAYQQALRARPDYTPFNSSGAYTSFAAVGSNEQGFQNPVALLTATNNAKTFSLSGSISGIYDFTSELQFKSTVSLNMQHYSQRNYVPSYVAIGSYYGNTSNNGGIGSNSNSQLTNWLVENTLTYNKIFHEDHILNVLAGYSYETRKTSFFSATASGYPNDNILNSLSSAITPLFTKGDNPSKPQSYLFSYYLRANYGFKDKYLLTFTGRTDGSSKFGPENKFGYFPSGAIAWRISKENFLKEVTWIDDIKIRGSYGVTGTQNIGDQMYRTLYTPYSYAGAGALVPTQLGNPRIQWETTKELDAGLDVSLFHDRLQATFDYYRKQTNNALLSLPTTPSSSYSSLLGNVVSLRNTGYEVSLQGDIIRAKNFRWNASVNVTWNKSMVTKLSEDADLSQIANYTGVENSNTALIEGMPLGLITGYNITGIIKTKEQLDAYKAALGSAALPAAYVNFVYLSLGDPMYTLSDENYPARHQIIASAAPKYYGGIKQGFSYKNFDLELYFTFSQGGKLMWGDHVSSISFVGSSNANAIMLNRWTPENPNSDQPRLLWKDQTLMNTSLSVFNSSYLKLRTVSFNYRFNQARWMKKVGIQHASLFGSATNLFTITKYPGNDPETSDDPYSVGGGYFDVSNYPTVRTFTAGFKATF